MEAVQLARPPLSNKSKIGPRPPLGGRPPRARRPFRGRRRWEGGVLTTPLMLPPLSPPLLLLLRVLRSHVSFVQSNATNKQNPKTTRSTQSARPPVIPVRMNEWPRGVHPSMVYVHAPLALLPICAFVSLPANEFPSPAPPTHHAPAHARAAPASA